MKIETSKYSAEQGQEDSRVEAGRLNQAIKLTQEYLLKIQSPQGYWAGELEADASVATGYIPLMYFMTGRVDPARQKKVINFVLSKQRSDGSWSAYHDGPGNLNVSIQNYFALKLGGVSAEESFMQKAKEFILSRGGIGRTNVFNKVWLAIFGQFDWRGAPSLPPEIILLPDWSYFNIYEFASWSRETIMALVIVLTKKPVCKVPDYASVSELYVEPEGRRNYPVGRASRRFSWQNFFLIMDSLFKFYERMPFIPGRGLAMRRTEKWVVDHQEKDGSWGGIMLPWVYSLIALKSLGYTLDNPVIVKGMKGLEDFIIEDDKTLRLQPATSPVWDTAWAVIALGQSGLQAGHPALARAARWLLSKEIRGHGDWQIKNKIEAGCWSFEFENDFYPDIDDTAVVPRALFHARLPESEEAGKAGAIKRGLDWVAGMQSSNGGWAAFDRNNNKQILANIPFADFMTPLDPTSPDVTAHAMELLGQMKSGRPSVNRALAYLKREQNADGSWYGRWGVNYIYGTGLVLAGLASAGEDITADYIRRAVSWLTSCQHPDGGWGETCQTYDEPENRGAGPSTASQTAWALTGLMAAGEQGSPAVRRGINYLLRTRQADGSWIEAAFTGTGFPRAFYLRYDLYRIYFPLMALAQYGALEGTNGNNDA